uniref:Uncharacterized protein n=1 Tax=Oryza nivara TaxID=4536 RepID=A0A0E0GN36_ORYNI
MKPHFQWIWSHIQIPSELVGIIETKRCSDYVWVMRHRLWAHWAVISLLGKVSRISAQLITRGDVVLRLQGTNCVDQKPDRVCVMFPLNQ